MKKLMLSAAGAASVLVGMAAFPTAAIAQAGNRSITIYGNDPCPRDAICIRAPESQRYRIPDSQNPQGTPQERNSWANKSEAADVGRRNRRGKLLGSRPGRPKRLPDPADQPRQAGKPAASAEADQAPQ